MYDEINGCKQVRGSEKIVEVVHCETRMGSTEAFAKANVGLAMPQLTPPKAAALREMKDMLPLVDAVRSLPAGNADASAALKRIEGNVERWEASVSEKVQEHTEAATAFAAAAEQAHTLVARIGDGGLTKTEADSAAAALSNAVAKEARCGATLQALPSTPEAFDIDTAALLTGTAKLTMALAQLEKMMSDSNIDALDSQRKMLNALSEKRQTSLQKSSDDYAAKVAEAQRLQDTIGEIAKIGGWALAIIGVGLAIFTGGASLVIAAAGLALMAADAIYKAATGTSFIDEAMQPVMDHAVKPMMEWLSKQVSSALESCGVSQEKAEIIGAVVAGVAVAAVMVTGIAVVGSVGGKVASVLAESTAAELAEVMESAVVRSAKNMIVTLADDTGVTTLASRAKMLMAELRTQTGLSELGEGQIQALATRGKIGLTVGETALSGTQAAVNTIAAADTRDASLMQAAITRALADKKVISQLLQELVTSLSNSNSAMTALGNAMSTTLKNEMAADTFVLNNARAV